MESRFWGPYRYCLGHDHPLKTLRFSAFWETFACPSPHIAAPPIILIPKGVGGGRISQPERGPKARSSLIPASLNRNHAAATLPATHRSLAMLAIAGGIVLAVVALAIIVPVVIIVGAAIAGLYA